MRFKGLDLNLLVALDALLDEQNVSRAAERLHLSQPAVSAALRRLRDYFEDPLLVQHGKRMLPTPHALRLRPKLKLLLGDIDQMVTVSARFDPATSSRRFRIGMSDFLTTIIGAELTKRLGSIAPNIGIELIPPFDTIVEALDQGEIDLMITPVENLAPDHPTEDLFEERFVLAGWLENPVFERDITMEDFRTASHIAVEIGRTRRASFAEAQLRRLGIERRIDIHVSAFSVVPELLVGTNRLAIMHERLAKSAATHLPIAHAPLPFEFPVMKEVIQFHRTRASDPGLIWLRQEIVRAAG
jgi:LysR family transcriptional regulator, nod-box dependent transcriptional activator